MDKSRLRPELQTIVDQFARFRNEYSSLKTHYAAQEELIKLQKIELEQMRFRVEQLASTMVDYQKRFVTTLNSLESENQRLQMTVDSLNRECENTRVNDNEYIQEVQRNNDEYSRRLEEHLAELRSKIASQEEKHEEQVKSIETRHREEIAEYEAKLEQLNFSEKRRSEEISAYKQKLEEMTCLQIRHNKEISAYKKQIEEANNSAQAVGEVNKKNAECVHPALQSGGNGNRRKKFAPASRRWPPLDVSTTKETAEAPITQQKKRKRLYRADNEAVIDLES